MRTDNLELQTIIDEIVRRNREGNFAENLIENLEIKKDGKFN